MIEMDMPKIDVTENEERSYAKIVVEPLEKGFGLTIGNCLRRILLSALPGAAAQGIKFMDGSVKHEFSAIPGVKEDVTEIILNLKLLAIKTKITDKDYTKTLRLCKEGPAVITAADIAQDAEVEIVNSDQYICTVDEGGKIDMEITIGRGRGYKPAKENKQPIIDYIPIDSIYTPVQKVNYNVEPARVGQNIDYDRLTIEVWTDGTFSGREIVSLAAKIMQDHIPVRQFVRYDQGYGYPRQDGRRQAAADPLHEDRGYGFLCPFLQLSEESKHSHGGRPDQQVRGRDAQSAQSWQEVPRRSHRQAGILRPFAGKKGGLKNAG